MKVISKMNPIKSSEISNYLFCPVSWWMSKTKGFKLTEAMKKGETYHNIISKNQSKAGFLYICIIIIIVIITALISYRFLI